MPKRYHRHFYSKPASTPPPTLASSSSLSNPRTASVVEREPQKSVNALLNELRSSRGSAAEEQASNSNNLLPLQVRTLHPSLNELLGVTVPLPPRPPPRRVGQVGPRNRVAGPPPPPSWARTGVNPEHNLKEYFLKLRLNRVDGGETQHESVGDEVPRGLYTLPDQVLIEPASLVHHALRAIAIDWKFHVEYHQHYLHTLRPVYKSLLLSYVCVYNKMGHMSFHDLNILFYGPQSIPKPHSKTLPLSPQDEGTLLDFSWDEAVLDDSSDDDLPKSKPTEDITHLDFSHHLSSHSLSIKPHLFNFLSSAQWPNLTHMSLAYPRFFQTSPVDLHWTRLYSLLNKLPTLTHLSLAGWPYPITTMERQVAQAEMKAMVSKLAKKTICLKWIDVSDLGIYGDLGYMETFFDLQTDGKKRGAGGGGGRAGGGGQTDNERVDQDMLKTFTLKMFTTPQEDFFDALIDSGRSIWDKYWRGLETVMIRDYRITYLGKKISDLIEREKEKEKENEQQKEKEKERQENISSRQNAEARGGLGLWASSVRGSNVGEGDSAEGGAGNIILNELVEFEENRKDLGRRLMKVIREVRRAAAEEGRGGGGAVGMGCRVLLEEEAE